MRVEVDRCIKQVERDVTNARKNIGIEAYEIAAFERGAATDAFLDRVGGRVGRAGRGEEAPGVFSIRNRSLP